MPTTTTAKKKQPIGWIISSQPTTDVVNVVVVAVAVAVRQVECCCCRLLLLWLLRLWLLYVFRITHHDNRLFVQLFGLLVSYPLHPTYNYSLKEVKKVHTCRDCLVRPSSPLLLGLIRHISRPLYYISASTSSGVQRFSERVNARSIKCAGNLAPIGGSEVGKCGIVRWMGGGGAVVGN